MRRISQLCGMELKQDVLVVKADALKKLVFSPGPSVNSSPGDTPLIGDANVASKKKKKKNEKRETWALPGPAGEWEYSQSN